MCGIAGIAGEQTDAVAIDRALSIMAHRGPDARDAQVIECTGRSVVLGHRRLSILDLSEAANQPFTSNCGRFTIVFNGEIYNHAELRAELAQRGQQFRTHSDTEVLVAGFAVKGLNFFNRLNGMYAFAILDRAEGRIVCSRDAVGIKPLYYRLAGSRFSFASELRVLEALGGGDLEVDTSCFAEFLLNGFLYEPATGFRNVAKVPPGHSLIVDLKALQTRLVETRTQPDRSIGSGDFASVLERQVGLEMQADVSVGVFFSGGIDSAAISAAAPRDALAFFVDYGDDQEGDRKYARSVADALGVEFRSTTLSAGAMSAEDILGEFRSVAVNTEEPVSDFTFVATRAISRAAREAGFKVMLSGMGGDELFAGYPRHALASAWPLLHRLGTPLAMVGRMLEKLPSWDKRAARLRSFATAPDFAQAYTSLIGYFSVQEVAELIGDAGRADSGLDSVRSLLVPVQKESALRQALHLDRYGFLAHNLTVTDRASMLESIEVRVPLLGNPVRGFAAHAGDGELRNLRGGKLVLRNYLHAVLPRHLVDRPKIGFNPPLDGRIARLGEEVCREILLGGPLGAHTDLTWISALLTGHFAGQANHSYRIWQLLYFHYWLSEYGCQKGHD